MIERYARKLAQGLIGNAEVEERWTRRFELMTCGFECIITFSVGCTSRGECQLVAAHHAVFVALAQGEGKFSLWVGSEVLQTRVGEEFYA